MGGANRRGQCGSAIDRRPLERARQHVGEQRRRRQAHDGQAPAPRTLRRRPSTRNFDRRRRCDGRSGARRGKRAPGCASRPRTSTTPSTSCSTPESSSSRACTTGAGSASTVVRESSRSSSPARAPRAAPAPPPRTKPRSPRSPAAAAAPRPRRRTMASGNGRPTPSTEAISAPIDRLAGEIPRRARSARSARGCKPRSRPRRASGERWRGSPAATAPRRRENRAKSPEATKSRLAGSLPKNPAGMSASRDRWDTRNDATRPRLSGLLSEPEVNSNETSRPPTMKLTLTAEPRWVIVAGVDEAEERPARRCARCSTSGPACQAPS